MTEKENKNFRILLASCIKEPKNKKRGILIIPNINELIEDSFYETNDFQAYCFCHFLIIEKTINNF